MTALNFVRVSLWVGIALCSGKVVAGSAGAPDDLLFVSNRQGSVFELYRMAADGGPAQRVVPERGEAGEMSWSPDGSKVLYTAARAGAQLNIFVSSVDKPSTQQLTHDALPSTEPTWSPDGKTIAFVSSRDGSRRIYLMDADGGHQRRLTDALNDDEFTPRFSPDGSKLVYIAGNSRLISPRIAMADLVSGKSSIVSDYPERAIESAPAWSPDGTRLLFTLIKGQTSHLFVMAADGRGRTQLTPPESVRNGQPAWSPDGRRILYLSVSAETARRNLLLMNADGSEQRKLYASDNDVMDAHWSTDGQRIFYVEQLASGGKIFSTDLAGRNIRRLSGSEGFDLNIQVCCSRPSAHMASVR